MNDLISRKDLIEKIKNTNGTVSGKDAELVKDVFEKALNYAIYLCEQAPTVEQKHGGWIVRTELGNGCREMRCSECCETGFWRNQPPYCPHCGAKMDGDSE